MNTEQELETSLNSTSDFADLLEMDQVALETDNETSTETETETETETQVETETATQTETETETKTDDDDEDELTVLRRQNELLLEQLNQASQPAAVKTENNETAEPSATVDDASLFGDWKFDDIIENEDSFKKFLGDFAKKVMTTTEERLLQKLPGTVSKLTTEQIEARQTVTSFYDEHKQLAAVKPFVAKVVSVVASEHADWDLPKVLDEAANRAYKALGLKKQAVEGVKTPGAKKPAFAGPASGRRGSGNTDNAGKSKLEKELEELMDLG